MGGGARTGNAIAGFVGTFADRRPSGGAVVLHAFRVISSLRLHRAWHVIGHLQRPTLAMRIPRFFRTAKSDCPSARIRLAAGRLLFASLTATLLGVTGTAVAADIEVMTPEGRKVILKDDGTWRYADAAVPPGAAASAAEPSVQAELSLLRRETQGLGCRLSLKLENKLPYPIGNLVPFLSALRPDGVVYQTMSTSFLGLRPGDAQTRTVDFTGIVCDDIGRVLVNGGDRCSMAELDQFTEGKGLCLARVKVLPSGLMRIEK